MIKLSLHFLGSHLCHLFFVCLLCFQFFGTPLVKNLSSPANQISVRIEKHGKSGSRGIEKIHRKPANFRKFTKLGSLITNRVTAGHATDIIVPVIEKFYLANLSIGSPPQSFLVLLDTLTPKSWVPSSTCEMIACVSHRRYSANSSTTMQPYDGTFESFGVEGSLLKDTISDLCVSGQTIGEATYIWDFFKDNTWDGVLGLGWNSDSKGMQPILRTLFEKKVIEKQMYGLWLNGSLGELTLGGVNKRLFEEPIRWFPRASSNSIAIHMNSISMGSQVLGCNHGCDVRLQVNGYYMIGPTVETDKIHAKMGFSSNRMPHTARYYRSNCSVPFLESLPPLSFNVGDHSFSLTAKEFKKIYPDKHICESMIIGFHGNPWILGNAFMTKYYTAFDATNSRVGLALAKN